MANRTERIKNLIVRNVSDIIQYELKDPKLGFATVIDADVSNDFSYAKIYVSFLGDNVNTRLGRLNSAKGFIRSSLAKKMSIRKIPELTFVLDETMDRGARIDQLLDENKPKSDDE